MKSSDGPASAPFLYNGWIFLLFILVCMTFR
jgi:hypothetical protein